MFYAVRLSELHKSLEMLKNQISEKLSEVETAKRDLMEVEQKEWVFSVDPPIFFGVLKFKSGVYECHNYACCKYAQGEASLKVHSVNSRLPL